MSKKIKQKKVVKKSFDKRFNILKTFEFNKEKGPFEKVKDQNKNIKKILGKFGIETDFFGYKTKLPLGVAAGPLYNKRYMDAAMNDGFTVITWKTFRSIDRLAHRNDGKFLGHNIVYLDNSQILEGNNFRSEISGSLKYDGDPENITITNSFGMPSQSPNIWMPEITEIEKVAKKKKKLIITSVVGTPREGGDIHDLATDYAHTAACAEASGATIIELNFSCPNVHGKEGQIYKDDENASIIAKTVRNILRKETKLLLKVGFASVENYKSFIEKTGPFIDGIVAINTIPLKIVDKNGKQALPGGVTSGTCGSIIIEKSVEAVKNLVEARKSFGKKYKHLKIVGCGGVTNAQNFMKHIEAGAEFVMCATAALFNPELPKQVAEYLKKNKIIRKI
jgi:dihydroorotate dehydrogenase